MSFVGQNQPIEASSSTGCFKATVFNRSSDMPGNVVEFHGGLSSDLGMSMADVGECQACSNDCEVQTGPWDPCVYETTCL